MNKTLDMLNKYLASRNIGVNDPAFGTWNSDRYGERFRHCRNKTAQKLQDPAIKGIRLYDLRHYFATMTYHKTRDILFTKQQMGRRKIKTTLIYTQLLQFDKDDNYTCKIAQNSRTSHRPNRKPLRVRNRNGRYETVLQEKIAPRYGEAPASPPTVFV